MTLPVDVAHIAKQARQASRVLACKNREVKDRFLQRLIVHLQKSQESLLQANAVDMQAGQAAGLSSAYLDRLKITTERLSGIAESLQQVISLPDPIGEIISGSVRPNGLRVHQVRVPLGVIFFIFESRPNVTLDAAALAIKSGNAIILRGGKEAGFTNRAFHQCILAALADVELPANSVQLIANPDRNIVTQLLKQNKYIDVVIPRGGEGLIRAVVAEATMPVLKHYQGVCHLYVDQTADLEMAARILMNGKCQRPGVCNALETLLVHQSVASAFLPMAGKMLLEKGVEIRGCQETCELLPQAKIATDIDYATEYLALILSCKVVPSLDAALEHIQQFSTGHSEAIVTRDLGVADRFMNEVDSAAVFVNASTRFHDGYELGLGAEIGISTDKMHARGPCGLLELTSYKYVIRGTGHVRS